MDARLNTLFKVIGIYDVEEKEEYTATTYVEKEKQVITITPSGTAIQIEQELFNQPIKEEPVEETDLTLTDKEDLIRNIIQYGITIDGVKEKTDKLFDFSFDYRYDGLEISDLEMELEETEEQIKSKVSIMNRLFKKKNRR